MNRALTFVSKGEATLSVYDFLKEHGFSRRTITSLKYEGGLVLNGENVTVRAVISPGDHLMVRFPQEQASVGLVKQKGPLEIIYEDDAVLIVYKPVGLAVIPSMNHPSQTLGNYIAYYFEQKGILSTVHIVTRLDTNTSGLVVVAKNKHYHHVLNEQIKNEQFERKYCALIEDSIDQLPFVIERPIARKNESIIERMVCDEGQYAKTVVHQIRKWNNFYLVELQLFTGRTHQVRVHLSSIGRPIVGDDLYGSSYQAIQGHALLCSEVSFKHPITGEMRTFTLDVVERMNQLLH